MICKPCANKKHKKCENFWSGKKRREVPTNTHCDCQHRISLKSGDEKSEGNNGDGS